MRSAKVWYGTHLAGTLEETDEGYRFTYSSDYLGESLSRPISQTLGLRAQPFEVKTLFPFFDGLIPEGWLLDLGTHNWKLDPRDRFGLLLAFCRNPIGAVGVTADE
jgi:serine/threonine-protein kinase HipA